MPPSHSPPAAARADLSILNVPHAEVARSALEAWTRARTLRGCFAAPQGEGQLDCAAHSLTHHVTLGEEEEGCSRPGFKPVATVVEKKWGRLKAGLSSPIARETFRNAAILASGSLLQLPRSTALQGVATSPSIGMLCVTPRWDRSIPGACLRLPEDDGVLFQPSCRRCTRTRQFRHTVDIVPPFRVVGRACSPITGTCQEA
jgi:hypothetical protein